MTGGWDGEKTVMHGEGGERHEVVRSERERERVSRRVRNKEGGISWGK